MIKIVSINTEDDAWGLLRSISEEKFDFSDESGIDIGNWSRIQVILHGKDFQGTFTHDSIKFIDALQKSVYRSYAIIKYGSPRNLTKDEKEKLKIIFSCGIGSSKFEAFLEKIVNQIFIELISGMDSKDKKIVLLTAILTIGVVWGGTSCFSTYSEERRVAQVANSMNEQTKTILEHISFSSSQETERAKIMEKIAAKNLPVRQILSESETSYEAMLKSAKTADKAEIMGLEITSEQVTELTKTPKSEIIETRVDGIYKVTGIIDPILLSNVHVVTVESENSKSRFKATLDSSTLSKEDIDTVFNAIRNHKKVSLLINARVKAGEVIDAHIMKATTEPDLKK